MSRWQCRQPKYDDHDGRYNLAVRRRHGTPFTTSGQAAKYLLPPFGVGSVARSNGTVTGRASSPQT